MEIHIVVTHDGSAESETLSWTSVDPTLKPIPTNARLVLALGNSRMIQANW
jgi:hypothetical protein